MIKSERYGDGQRWYCTECDTGSTMVGGTVPAISWTNGIPPTMCPRCTVRYVVGGVWTPDDPELDRTRSSEEFDSDSVDVPKLAGLALRSLRFDGIEAAEQLGRGAVCRQLDEQVASSFGFRFFGRGGEWNVQVKALEPAHLGRVRAGLVLQKGREGLCQMKAYILDHDARTLIHVSADDLESVKEMFPEYTVRALVPATTPDTFHLHVRTIASVDIS